MKPVNYVLGFAFSFETDQDLAEYIPTFLLIEKQRPDWQAGLLNGIGGKIEPLRDSSPLTAMRREFREECGLETSEGDWEQIIRFHLPTGGMAYCFRAFLEWEQFSRACTTTDEPVKRFKANSLEFLRHRMLPNVPWLIELARAIEPDRGMMCVEYKHKEGA